MTKETPRQYMKRLTWLSEHKRQEVVHKLITWVPYVRIEQDYWINRDQIKLIEKRSVLCKKVIKNWKEYKRCKNCDILKELQENFHKRWTSSIWSIRYSAYCNICRSNILRNKRKPIYVTIKWAVYKQDSDFAIRERKYVKKATKKRKTK